MNNVHVVGNVGQHPTLRETGNGTAVANVTIATNRFYKDRDGRPAFPVDSFFDVYSGKIPADRYRDKIVLVGPTAPGLGTASVTPVCSKPKMSSM